MVSRECIPECIAYPLESQPSLNHGWLRRFAGIWRARVPLGEADRTLHRHKACLASHLKMPNKHWHM